MENKNTLNKNEIQKIDWEKIQLEMKNKFGKDIFDSWLRKINFSGEFSNYILLNVSTRFLRDWITSSLPVRTTKQHCYSNNETKNKVFFSN